MKDIFFKTLFFILISSSSHAVTNQELMDRLDDIESAQQQREMDRLMDEYTRVMTQPRPYSAPPSGIKSKNAPKQNEICYVFYDGIKFQLGKTESEMYKRFIRQFHGIDKLEIAIPKDTEKNINSKKDITKTNLRAIDDFVVMHWARITSLCGF